MRIDGRTQQLSKLQKNDLRALGHQEPTRNTGQCTRRSDQVTLSSRAQEIKQLYQALSTVPTERAERVAALRQAIENGSYEIPEEELADRMVGVIYPQR